MYAEMDFEFDGPVIEWRGPAPFYYVRIPEEEQILRAIEEERDRQEREPGEDDRGAGGDGGRYVN